MTRMKYIGLAPDSLSNGRPVEPGEVVKVDADKKGQLHPDDKRLVDSGLLISVEEKTK